MNGQILIIQIEVEQYFIKKATQYLKLQEEKKFI